MTFVSSFFFIVALDGFHADENNSNYLAALNAAILVFDSFLFLAFFSSLWLGVGFVKQIAVKSLFFVVPALQTALVALTALATNNKKPCNWIKTTHDRTESRNIYLF